MEQQVTDSNPVSENQTSPQPVIDQPQESPTVPKKKSLFLPIMLAALLLLTVGGYFIVSAIKNEAHNKALEAVDNNNTPIVQTTPDVGYDTGGIDSLLKSLQTEWDNQKSIDKTIETSVPTLLKEDSPSIPCNIDNNKIIDTKEELGKVGIPFPKKVTNVEYFYKRPSPDKYVVSTESKMYQVAEVFLTKNGFSKQEVPARGEIIKTSFYRDDYTCLYEVTNDRMYGGAGVSCSLTSDFKNELAAVKSFYKALQTKNLTPGICSYNKIDETYSTVIVGNSTLFGDFEYPPTAIMKCSNNACQVVTYSEYQTPTCKELEKLGLPSGKFDCTQ